MRFIPRNFAALSFGVAAFAIAPPPIRAEADGVSTIIATRLAGWMEAFNAREASRTCDLFSTDLISTMRGRPDEGRDAICKRIARTLADGRLSIHYTLQIKEIIVSGDLAVVRVDWLVTTKIGGSARVSHEPGIDIFRREADGKWRVIRFLAFSVAGKRSSAPH